MKKILIISDSTFLKDYLSIKFENLPFQLIFSKDALDGLIKMRNLIPDLIIMDFDIKRMTITQFLQDKQDIKTTQDIPIILLYSKNDKIDKTLIKKIAKTKLYKLFLKPIEVDNLINSISKLFKTKIEIDSEPSQIDINLNNNNILLIQVSKGLNREKLELMKYKILNYKNYNKFKLNKILLILSDININDNTDKLLDLFIYKIIHSTEANCDDIILLTSDEYIKGYYQKNNKYKIYLSDNYASAINILESKENIENPENSMISIDPRETNSAKNKTHGILFNLNFASEKLKFHNINFGDNKFNIAMINNDIISSTSIKEIFSGKSWDFNIYNDGRMFINSLKTKKPDLVFLDLVIPELNGFEILKFLRQNYPRIPIIILGSVNNKQNILKAMSYGIKHYLTKPYNTDKIIKKTEEALYNKLQIDTLIQ